MPMIRRLVQPDGSEVCGQTCVAMAAGVSLPKAVEIVGHDRGTTTREIVRALRTLGVPCADRLHRLSRIRPTLPKRAIVAIYRPKEDDRRERAHWMLQWDGTMYDPGNAWPDRYQNWRITSYLEILS